MTRLAAILACLSLAGCSSAPSAETPSVADLGAEFTIVPGAAVAVNSTAVTVRFVSVTEDSRCPRDVTCVWGGEVKVRLEIQDAKSRSTVELREGESRDVGPHRLTLVRVDPQPVSTVRITPQDYRVTLKLEGAS